MTRATVIWRIRSGSGSGRNYRTPVTRVDDVRFDLFLSFDWCYFVSSLARLVRTVACVLRLCVLSETVPCTLFRARWENKISEKNSIREVLSSAEAARGCLRSQFLESRTEKQKFHVEGFGTVVNVPMTLRVRVF